MVPAIIKTHGHGAYERLHTGGGLVIRCPETSTNILVVQNLIEHTHISAEHMKKSKMVYLNFKCEVFFEVLDDHDKEREFDAQGFLRIGWTCDVRGAVYGTLA